LWPKRQIRSLSASGSSVLRIVAKKVEQQVSVSNSTNLSSNQVSIIPNQVSAMPRLSSEIYNLFATCLAELRIPLRRAT
jgi:hypothetical protein